METIIMAVNGVVNTLRQKVLGSQGASGAPIDQRLTDTITVLLMQMELSTRQLSIEATHASDNSSKGQQFYTAAQHHTRMARAMEISALCALALEQATEGKLAAAADNATLAIREAERI